jgi:hypothetical protein
MSRWSFHVDQILPTQTVWDWIITNTDIRQAMADIKPSEDGLKPVLDVPHRLDVEDVTRRYIACEADVGELRGFATANGSKSSYASFSLTWNPFHIDGLHPYYSTLGTPRNKSGEFFALARPAEQPVRKNSYWDAYGFTSIHDVVRKHLGPVLDRFQLTPVRSRAATIRCNDVAAINSPEFMWHLDESPFCNLRLNIPLITAPEYLMEIDSEHKHVSMPHRVVGRDIQWKGHLKVGHCYSWNTELAHRVFAQGAPAIDRVHLVFGFSPWFDFDAASQTWRSNAFYGKIHPLDMAARGMFFNAHENRESVSP